MTKNSRRQFSKRLAQVGVGATILSGREAKADSGTADKMVVPPVGATQKTTACNYCIVGCGYKTYSWPVGESGGLDAQSNALGRDYSNDGVIGLYPWPSPQMHNIVAIDGQPHHLVIQPDPSAQHVNLYGDHNLGGSLARKLYSQETGTGADRFLGPKLRVEGELINITWDEAISIVAQLTEHTLLNHGRTAWGLKSYSYQFYENTYAITKFALGAVGTPCWAPHDQPGDGSSTPGLSDAGINAFSATYEEWSQSDVIFMSGVSAYDTKGVLFTNWVMPSHGDRRPIEDRFDFQDGSWLAERPFTHEGGPTTRRLIVVDPVRTMTAELAERYGGLHLKLIPGTDAVLQNAIARVILEEGWEDSDFITTYVGGVTELEQETGWRRVHHALSFDAYRTFIESDAAYTLEEASRITGVSTEDIFKAAELLAKPLDGVRPKASYMLEKGNYWSHNYVNSASFASLGLLTGAGHRSGQVISRAGGHQRGMIKGASYPTERSAYTEETTGNENPIGHNLDDWIIQARLRMAWAIGCTWAGGGTASAQQLFGQIHSMTQSHPIQLRKIDVLPNGESGGVDVEAVVAGLAARMDAVDEAGRQNGMVFIQQDIYPSDLTELADVVLAPYSWGEADFTRMQGERRLRLYAQVMDPPGDTRADWWIVAEVAKRLQDSNLPNIAEDPENGYDFSGFNWSTEREVFEEAAQRSGGVHAYQALVEYAQSLDRSPYDVLAERGTQGYQCPLQLGDDGALLETEQNVHAGANGESSYNTVSKKAFFVRGDWRAAESNQERWKPRSDELWIVNRRTSTNWSAMIEDARNPYRTLLAGENILELHPEDAERIGVSTGDNIFVETTRDENEATAAFEAVAHILPSNGIRKGVAAVYFNYFGSVKYAANNVVPRDTDPNGMMYPFKLGRGRVSRA